MPSGYAVCLYPAALRLSERDAVTQHFSNKPTLPAVRRPIALHDEKLGPFWRTDSREGIPQVEI